MRVLPGAEYGAFEAIAIKALEASPWLVTEDANPPGLPPVRAGTHLDAAGTAFPRHHARYHPGAAVGPADHPAGRSQYLRRLSKIAHVIEADLWRLGQAPVGSRLSFAVVNRGEAVAALKETSVPRSTWRAAFAALARKDKAHRGLPGRAVRGRT